MKLAGQDLNKIITEVAVAIKTDRSLIELVNKYGEEVISDAMQFISYEFREYEELEEDYELEYERRN